MKAELSNIRSEVLISRQSSHPRIRFLEFAGSNTKERLADIEERIFTLERKASGSKE